MDEEARKALEGKVTEFSPELQRLKKVDSLVKDEAMDAMSDLHEREIAAIALFRALDKKIIAIPATMDFLENLISLRRSRDRMGREEFVRAIKNSIRYSINPYYDEPQQGSPGILSRIAGFIKGKKGGE